MPQTSQLWWSAERGGGSADADDEVASTAAAESEGGVAGFADDELVLEGRCADATDDEAGADAAAADEAPPSVTPINPRADADAAGEGGGGEEGTANDGDVDEVDGPSVAALGGFPPFFFVMAWCVGVLCARWAVAGAVAVSVHHTRGPSALSMFRDTKFTRSSERSVVPLPVPTRPPTMVVLRATTSAP